MSTRPVVSLEAEARKLSSAAIIHGAVRPVDQRMFVVGKPDDDLLARLQRRDPQALAELYDRYGAMVFRLILRIVGDRGIAEDLVQETFFRVWNRASALDPERGAAAPWLLAVARNRAIDYVRVHAHRNKSTIKVDDRENPEFFVDFPADSPNFDLARQVKRAFEQLSPHQRETIELAYFEGLTQSEIAERMGQPLGTVKTWMRRAFQQMREVLVPARRPNV